MASFAAWLSPLSSATLGSVETWRRFACARIDGDVNECSLVGWALVQDVFGARTAWEVLTMDSPPPPLAVGGSIALLVFVALLCWFLQLVTREYSWVDRLWSIVPALYSWYLTYTSGSMAPRGLLMSTLATLWAIRLTFNFARRGGYSGMEDYRWAYVRTWPVISNPLVWEVFAFAFIAVYQHLLLFLISAVPVFFATSPAVAIMPVGPVDMFLVLLFLGLLTLETVCDQQQYEFQEAKHAAIRAKRPLTPEQQIGFCTTGVFRYSRHANFFSEQSMWWVFSAFVFAATGDVRDLIHPTFIGPLLLSALFQGSTPLTEHLTATKYPAYADYQRVTSCLIPWPPSGPLKITNNTGGKKKDE